VLNEKAGDIARSFAGSIIRQPFGYMMFMCALDFALGPTCEVAIVGNHDDVDTIEMLNALTKEFLPNKVVLLVDGEKVHQIANFTEGLTKLARRSTAYICIGHQCKLPTNDLKELLNFYKDCRRSIT
jgi:uncharacterized protein YyaL (SSP411 family)